MDKLFYNSPAKKWTDALPLGNGYTGVMVYGGIKSEKLMFNDSTLWSGYPKDQDNPESLEYLDEVRDLIMEGDNVTAKKIIEKKFTGDYSEAFLPLGEVDIKFYCNDKTNYKRCLNISDSILNISTAHIEREAFASYPDKVFVYKITSKMPISITLKGKSKLKYEISTENGDFNILGNAPDFTPPHYLKGIKATIYNQGKGMSFCLSTRIVTNGTISTNKTSVLVANATDITIYFTTATGFVGYDKMPKTARQYAYELAQDRLNSLDGNYEEHKQNHIADYKAIYNKQCIKFNNDVEVPTNILVKNAKQGKIDSSMIELVYNYGKYLLISSSRKGGSACNLQGIWNKDIKPAWSSNYTVNINTEMNYWGMSQCNLTECAEPFVRLVYEVMKRGKLTANTNFNCTGFTCNHNVDIWRKTAPVKGNSCYMFAPLCGVWLANELYEHLKYGDMEQYRQSIERINTEAVRFALDFLILRNGEYITCPSTSPEATFIKDKSKVAVDHSSAFDLGLIRQLFTNFKEFSNDEELLIKVDTKLKKLKPFTCGENGLNEWSTDYPIIDKGHRHFSPLYAFYPAKVIGYHRNKEQKAWVEKLYNTRIENLKSTIGWSSIWAICIAARLRKADTAQNILQKMLKSSFFNNLFDCYFPPRVFQIDANLGFLSAINELLVTEEDGVIELLPALPSLLKDGEIKNIRTATANEISFTWKNGKITSLVVKGKPMKLRNIHLQDGIQIENVELVD